MTPPTGLGVAESEIVETATNARVKITATADAPLGMLNLAAWSRKAAPRSATPRSVEKLAENSNATKPIQPMAATMIVVEVVRPAARPGR